MKSPSGGSGEDVGAAVVAYLRAGLAASPGRDAAAVAALAGPGAAERLLDRVSALVQESLAVPVDWDRAGLADAGRQVAAEMGRRHHELTEEALAALAWNFTFAWR